MKIFIIAGEPSGDFHASELIRALKDARPEAEFFSAGGPELKQCTRQVADLSEIAVTGLFEVLSFLPTIFRVAGNLVKQIQTIDPDIVIFTDFPDFNFHIAKRIAKPGRKLVYFISPQLWAWRKGRIRLVKQLMDKMLVIFPFEAVFYRKQKVGATFVGNPVVNTIRHHQYKPSARKHPDKKRILILPGSRTKEIRMNLPAMVEAKRLIEKTIDVEFSVLKHPSLSPELFQCAYDANIDVIEGNSFDEFADADFAIACSGTVTVELALSGVPAVVMYRMAPATFYLVKAMVRVSAISMPNIILGHHVYPELIQHEATSENIALQTISFLTDETKYNEAKHELKRLHNLLMPFDARLAASEVLSA